ncbi:MAG: TetR/AcrR family transcriptional regulator [Chloroflexi bacterium]|nr:TetR/AcrR family transcriptional regulator [Chloroflexota bacterium]MDA1146701.1 TetR/AcrR family transcriptional regulator [Chloroflexota bacterium]
MTKVRDLDQLLDVAARLFGERGYEATTLEEIAQELGILKGSLYHYISSKAELHQLVTRRRLDQLIDDVELIAALDIPADVKLTQALRKHLGTIHDFYPESSQWFVQPAPPKSSTDESAPADPPNRTYERVIRQIVTQGVRDGIFRADLDPQVMVLSVLGSCNWLTLWYQRGGRLTIDQVGDTIIAMALDGLRATTGSTPPRRRAAVAAR